MTDERINDMTTGRPGRLLIRFTLPIFAGNLLQQMYTVIDASIIGHGVGIEGLAAVGATDWLYWLFLWTAAGFGQGFAIDIAIIFGEKNESDLAKCIRTAIMLSLCAGAAMSLIGVSIASPLLKLMNTPENIIGMSRIYLSILYGGVIVVLMYNMGGCILRALGDSKTPFRAIVFSSLLNIVLDFLFVIVFKWGVGGAAAATVFSQFVSTVYTFIVIGKLSVLKGSRGKWKLEKSWAGRLWRKGWVMALQMSFMAIGGIISQYVVNGIGFIYVAGLTAGGKLVGLIECLAMSLGNGLTAYVGQNYGAGKPERIREGIRKSLIASAIACIITSAILLVVGENLLSLFITASSDQAPEAMAIAKRFLLFVIAGMIFLYIIHIYRQSFVGLGKTLPALLSGCMESVCRIFIAFVLIKHVSTKFVFTIEPLTWAATGVMLMIMWIVSFRRQFHLGGKKDVREQG